MKELTAFIKQQLCPALFERIPLALPEHAFIKVGPDWHSQTYMSGEKHPSRSDKCVVTAVKPSHILEQGGQALSLVDYVMQRDGISLLQAVKHVAELCGLAREFEALATSRSHPRQASVEKRTQTYKSGLIGTKTYESELKCTDMYTFGRNGKEWEAFGNKCKDLESPEDEPCYFYHNTDILPTYAELTSNHFVAYLAQLPGWNRELAENAAKKYQVGTAKKGVFSGSPIFWRFSQEGQLCPSKIMRYEKDGKRVKTPPLLTWTKRKAQYVPLQNPPYFYGLPLLKIDAIKPIALVESEKTAIIASMYLPQFIWIATGGDSYFSATVNEVSNTRMAPLKGRKVVLFPDLDKVSSWQKKAQIWADLGYEMHLNTFVQNYSHLVQQKTADLADFFAQIDLKEFRKNPQNT